MSLLLIAAQSENRVIGNGSSIPWRVKGEQQLFKRITDGHTLIMGRKTFESIGRPLPGRETVIISRNKTYRHQGCLIANSLSKAIELADSCPGDNFVAGGGEIYALAIDLADGVHLTTIHKEVEGDVYFPELPDDFVMRREEFCESNINYTYRYYERRHGQMGLARGLKQ